MPSNSIKEPKISFGRWEPYYLRGATTSYDPFVGLPPEFDVSGIYLWAHFKNKRQKEANKDGNLHLNRNIVYIGKSRKITRRLEGSRHEKVNEYRKQFNDPSLKCLYYSICYTDWTTWDFQKKNLGRALNACLLYIERKLIWEFAKTYSDIPILNRE
jgi:hypothetical protein